MGNVIITPKTNEISKIKLKNSDIQHSFIDEAARESLSNVQISLDSNYRSTNKVLELDSPQANDTFQDAIQKLHTGLYEDEEYIIKKFKNTDDSITNIQNTTITNYSNQYLTFEALEDCTFKFTNDIKYLLNNEDGWMGLDINSSIFIAAGKKIMWKARLTPDDSNGVGTFSSDGNFNIEGNPMSLLYGDNFIGQTDLTGKDYAFYRLFERCDKLINAKNLLLSATILAEDCYSGMFDGCKNLIIAPELPATTLADWCYSGMFYGCTSLTTTPELPATTLASNCYQEMFRDCTSLINAPSILPATILTEGCYHRMFSGCTSLIVAPELPAITLTQSCYAGMFQSCRSLITAPKLPATTLANGCYQGMFNNCTSLTTAPELPATKLVNNCYSQMFYGCSNLNFIKALFIILSNECVGNWVTGVARTGIFVTNQELEINSRPPEYIPSGWTIYSVKEYEVVRHYELPVASTTVTENDTNAVSGGAVYNKFEELIGTAPATLDTLEEIAAALNNDADLAGTLTTQISSKVPKVSNPTTDNFASFNSDGTIKDSGHSHSDYITSETQPNWEETDITSAAYIQNKPTISATVTENDTNPVSGGAVYTATNNINQNISDIEEVVASALVDLDSRLNALSDTVETILQRLNTLNS